MNWLKKLGQNFKKTSSNIKSVLLKKKIDEEYLEALEEALLLSDLGVQNTSILLEELRAKKVEEKNVKKEVLNFFINQFNGIKNDFVFKKHALPQVVLVFGVNGSGKTTTIAKLANKAIKAGLKTCIVAADTFRAAATEQMQKWGDKLDCRVFVGKPNEDPSAVVFKAHKEAIANKTEFLIIDTAGRLHNKIELMEELKKILRTFKKNDETAPHDKILILDSTIGQNTYAQIDAFEKIIGLSGIIMTKLDGSAKGGCLVAISKKYKLPIHAIGVGETLEDLIDFVPKDFVQALIGESIS